MAWLEGRFSLSKIVFLLFTDILPYDFFIKSHRRNKIPSCPHMLPGKVPLLFSVPPCSIQCTFPPLCISLPVQLNISAVSRLIYVCDRSAYGFQNFTLYVLPNDAILLTIFQTNKILLRLRRFFVTLILQYVLF